MATKYMKPAWIVSVGSSFWSKITAKDNDTISYDTQTAEIPVIKTLGLARTNSELKIFASGITYDYISQTTSAEITLGSVALPSEMLATLEGATQIEGFTLNNTNDIGKEFAFGYWAQLSNGEFFYFWHPVCKLAIDDEEYETRTEDIPEPNPEYRIIVLPYNGLWRVKYSTEEAKAAGFKPLTKDEFFMEPIYSEATLPTQTPLAPVQQQTSGGIGNEI